MAIDITLEVECRECGRLLEATTEVRRVNGCRESVIVVEPCDYCMDDAVTKAKKEA